MKKWGLLFFSLYFLAIPLKAETQWWNDLNDPDITQLVATIRAQNLDIKESSARITQAQAIAYAAQATQLPAISLIGSASYGNSIWKDDTSLTRVGIQAQWAPDIFNQSGSAIKAATSRVTTAEYTREILETKLICDAITTLLTLKQTQNSLLSIQKLINTLTSYQKLAEQQKDSGMISLLTFHDIENQVLETEQQKELLASIYSASKAGLNKLLGVTQNQEILTNNTLSIPTGNLRLDPEEFQKNPDIQRAFSTLKASDSDLAQAESLAWPTLMINGYYQVQEASAPTLQTDNTIRTLSADLTMPLFNFGRTQSKIDLTNAQKNEAWLHYRVTISKVIQNKLALADEYKNKLRIHQFQEKITENITQTALLTEKQFRAGLIPKQNRDLSEANMYKSQLMLQKTQADTARAYVAYQSFF